MKPKAESLHIEQERKAEHDEKKSCGNGYGRDYADRTERGRFLEVRQRRHINYLRRQKVMHTKVYSLEEQADEIASAEPSMDELMIVMEHKERLYEVWGQLPEEDLILLEGKYILRCTDSELAEQLHCKPDSVRMKLTRVRRKVFRMMNSNGGDSE